MNKPLATRTGSTALAAARPMSEPLRVALYFAMHTNELVGVSPETRHEAAALGDALAPACAPVGVARVVGWLNSLNLAMSQPLDGPTFLKRSRAIAEALADMPVEVFSVARRLELSATFKFFPGVAELVEHLGPPARELTFKLRALRAIADHAPPPAPPPEPLSQEERDRIVAASRARRLATPPVVDPPPRKFGASVITPEQLARMRAGGSIKVH